MSNINLQSLENYLEYIREEIKQLQAGDFTGNVDFKFNFKEGNIYNINISLNKSVKI